MANLIKSITILGLFLFNAFLEAKGSIKDQEPKRESGVPSFEELRKEDEAYFKTKDRTSSLFDEIERLAKEEEDNMKELIREEWYMKP
jgi:hypothetical protein